MNTYEKRKKEASSKQFNEFVSEGYKLSKTGPFHFNLSSQYVFENRQHFKIKV